ncbi:MAG: vWA domain-containing protein [Planctomycetota bacterium]
MISSARELVGHRGAEDKERILGAIDQLQPSGSTYAEEGIKIGYRMAARAFRKGAVNRIILCSDGVANVGNTAPASIFKQIEQYAGQGITLSAVGFGMGNYNDVLMEQLADKGDGNYAYVDTLAEARRIFVENLTGTLQVVARDVKVQVEFDKDVVRSYRLIGYENRDVADEDFRSDTVDGGEIGAGHSATALYELKLWPGKAGKLATVRLRYKDADAPEAREVERDIATADSAGSFDAAGRALKLAACAAEFAEILRKSYWARGSKLRDVLELAGTCRNDYDHRADVEELLELVRKADRLNARSGELEEAESAAVGR